MFPVDPVNHFLLISFLWNKRHLIVNNITDQDWCNCECQYHHDIGLICNPSIMCKKHDFYLPKLAFSKRLLIINSIDQWVFFSIKYGIITIKKSVFLSQEWKIVSNASNILANVLQLCIEMFGPRKEIFEPSWLSSDEIEQNEHILSHASNIFTVQRNCQHEITNNKFNKWH